MQLHVQTLNKPADPTRGSTETKHPSGGWAKSRSSKRFHFKADRLTDFSSFSQVPLLETFLRDIETTLMEGRQDLERSYHEEHDAADSYRFLQAGQNPSQGTGGRRP